MKHLSLLFVILFAFTTSARADFEVKVSADGKTIETESPIGGRSSFSFENGRAVISPYSADSGGIFFVLGDSVVDSLEADGYEVYSTRKGSVVTNVGTVYFVVAVQTGIGKIALLFPVVFSPFGVSLHASETEVYHAGTVYFSERAIDELIAERKKL